MHGEYQQAERRTQDQFSRVQNDLELLLARVDPTADPPQRLCADEDQAMRLEGCLISLDEIRDTVR